MLTLEQKLEQLASTGVTIEIGANNWSGGKWKVSINDGFMQSNAFGATLRGALNRVLDERKETFS